MHSPSRFSRQERFAPFGAAGQERLAGSRVAVVGLGGLGSSLALFLARAGVGELRLIDRDVVEESNLPRQMLYTAEDAREGLPKAEAAARNLRLVGGPTRLVAQVRDLSLRTVQSLLEGIDLVLDGLDNFEGRYLLNDACHQRRIPWVYGGAVASSGTALLIGPEGRPCLRCLFPDALAAAAETCETVGVLSPFPTMIAALQACEALRFLAEERPQSRLWHLDPWSGRAFVSEIERGTEDCPCCGQRRYPALVPSAAELTTQLCGRGTMQVVPPEDRDLVLADLAAAWRGLGVVKQTPFLARLETEGLVVSVFPDGRALIQGVDSAERARSIYARYVGA